MDWVWYNSRYLTGTTVQPNFKRVSKYHELPWAFPFEIKVIAVFLLTGWQWILWGRSWLRWTLQFCSGRPTKIGWGGHVRIMSYWQLSQGTAFDLRSKSAIRSLEPSVVFFCFCISCYSNFKSTRSGTQGPIREAPLHMHWFHCLHACGTTFYQVNSTQKWSFCLWVAAMPISERCKVFALAESAGALIAVRHCIGRCDMVSLNLPENLEISFSLILATL